MGQPATPVGAVVQHVGDPVRRPARRPGAATASLDGNCGASMADPHHRGKPAQPPQGPPDILPDLMRQRGP
jgi:hypothetical protein